MIIENIILLTILVILSAFFSSTEMAFVSSNKIKIEIKARKKNIAAQSALYYINNPDKFFSSILLGNTIVNIAFASLSAVFMQMMGLDEYQILVISTIVVLIICELIPKYFAREYSDRFFVLSAIPLRITSLLLYPLIKITAAISKVFSKSIVVKNEKIDYLFNKEDIEGLVKESQEAGVVNKKESDIISKLFALGEQRVYEAMRPRTEIVGVELMQSIAEVTAVFIDSGYSKIPVYNENLDNIKGVIFAYDLFTKPDDLISIIRDVLFVPETKKSFELLNEFLNKRTSIAIVVDEFGGTAGIVTIEDLIEELFGEIKDEYDIEEEICKKIAENTYLISGKVEVDHINERFNLSIPIGDYETISGYISTRIGRIPGAGENLLIDDYSIHIARATPIKVELVKINVNPDLEKI